MPKAIQYQKGSIIYFENDNDERIFILQKGVVILTSTDIETGGTTTTQLTTGEFFGAKSALGHFPREETATVLQDAMTISMTVPEFESIFANNKQVVYKMLRVFSGQLREMHKKSKALLSSAATLNIDSGMSQIAMCFFSEKQYRSCMDVCLKYLKLCPNALDKDSIVKMYEQAKKFEEKGAGIKPEPTLTSSASTNKALAQFMLPAFERFQKKYESGQVIICEQEPGDSFYLIQSGEVQLVKCVNNAIKNLDILRPGEFFGEMAILDKSPRSATCVANGPVQCLEFNKENFEVLVAGNPQIALILLKLFCKRIYDQKQRFKLLLLKDPTAKVAEVFCMYDEMYPPARPGEKQRMFNITIQDIAQWAGLPLQVVDEEVSKFVSHNKVELSEKTMIVTNITEMKKLVEKKMLQRHV